MPIHVALDCKSPIRLIVVSILTGIGAGLGGMLLALVLHVVQHIAYGYSLDDTVGGPSFLQGIDGASPERRVLVMTLCGLVAGFGWWAVQRFGRPLVSIKQAVKVPDTPMPMLSTLVHALLQIVTVALGSPLGREVAPREVGSLVAGWLARVAGLSANETRLMIACGAGAGLAAVYNVPLGGAVFVLEVLLVTFDAIAIAIALVTSVIAAVVAWLAGALLVLKVVISASSLRVGAHGGLLTPSLTVGALLAVVLGSAWNLAGAPVPSGAFALVGAAAFLASSMNMPITSIILVAEFTHLRHDMLVPVVLAVADSIGASRVRATQASRSADHKITNATATMGSNTSEPAAENLRPSRANED